MDELTKRLWHNVKRGNLLEVSAVLEQGADIDSRNKMKRTPLMEAAKRGNQSIISLLLARGADINAQDGMGTTPLMSALRPDYTEVVTLLLAKGADATIADKSGDTPSKLLGQKQVMLVPFTLLSILIFVLAQFRSTKDKDLRRSETIAMAARLYDALVTYQKYEGIKKLLQSAEGVSRHDH